VAELSAERDARLVDEHAFKPISPACGLKRNQTAKAMSEYESRAGDIHHRGQVVALVLDRVARPLRAAAGSPTTVNQMNLETAGQLFGQRPVTPCA
jgi:hypothetical protein